MNNKNEWQQHPVVFVHYGTYEALKNQDGILVFFLSSGGWASKPYNPTTAWSHNLRELYEAAERQGLTRGSTFELKMVGRED